THFSSPNDAFNYLDEIALTFAWDDSGWINGFTLAPYATLALEVGGGQATGDDRGLFLGLGIEPSHTFEATPIGDLTLSLPIEVGFSLDDYYQDDDGDNKAFGYLTIGLGASVPLPFPSGFGAWSLSAGVDYLILGSSNKALNDGDSAEWIIHAGISVEF
ncbi:MAG: hypothetical protein ACNA8P_09515, partial [Phycisphaerales bacterium]